MSNGSKIVASGQHTQQSADKQEPWKTVSTTGRDKHSDYAYWLEFFFHRVHIIKDLQPQPTLTKSDIFTLLPEAELILQGENVRICISCRVYSDFDAVS